MRINAMVAALVAFVVVAVGAMVGDVVTNIVSSSGIGARNVSAKGVGPLNTALSGTITLPATGVAQPITLGDGCMSIYCDNNSTRSVFLGGSGVAASGLCISKDTASCPRRDFPADFACGALYARTTADAGTTTLNCLVGR